MAPTFHPQRRFEPRPYQSEALESWSRQGRGVVVLPTGAGKTAVGCLAIEHARERTLIVVPTVDLVDQWERAVREMLAIPSEQVKKGFPAEASGPQLTLFPWEPSDVLIATYQGASQHLNELHHFGLLIFDEVHHLPAPVFRRIADEAPAKLRLGLSATPERYDGAEADLDSLVGPTVYREAASDLGGRYLAPYRTEVVEVGLEPDEQARYQASWDTYISFVRRNRLRMPQGFQQLIKRAGRDAAARKALEGHRTAREIALSARNKVEAVRELISHHQGERILIFCQHVELAERLGRMLLLPVATHETPKGERAELLRAFREGDRPVLVATSILDEGVDVPDATVGVIVSGTGQQRQWTQRLGRIIRPGEGKEAVLYEIVTRNTLEERSARRRRGT